MFEELEVVELRHDIKEHNLKEGDTGTIVLVYKKGKAYEVEFVAPNGRTIALLTLIPEDIRSSVNKEKFDINKLNLSIRLDTSINRIFAGSADYSFYYFRPIYNTKSGGEEKYYTQLQNE